ncbi:guanylate-binding protein 4, partial [Cricetulus griseus]
FSLGSTVQSHTKGIWMWCVPHPQKPDHTLILLDIEGLGDIDKKKCFAFYLPTEWKRLSELENLHDDELDSDFVQQETEFCSFIFSSSKAKALPGGIEINGALEQAKAESAQAAVKILKEMEEKHLQMMKEKERCHQERVGQLTEEMERERAQIVEEQEGILAHKLQVQCNWIYIEVLIHFVYDNRYGYICHSSTFSSPVMPAPFVEDAFYFPLYDFGFFLKNQVFPRKPPLTSIPPALTD